MLKIDVTLIVQIINFLLLLFLLNQLLYKPIRRIIRRRSDEFGSLSGSIEEFQKRLDEARMELEELKMNVKREGFKARENMKRQGMEKEKELLEQANLETEKILNEARERLRGDVSKIRKELEADIGRYSKDLAEKLLGRSI